MTTVFLPIGSEGYELAQPVSERDFDEIASKVDGRPRESEWTPIKFQLVRRGDHDEQLLESDAPWLGDHALVLRCSAAEALEETLGSSTELLPLECSAAQLRIVNPLCVVDALDEDASDVRRLAGSGRIFSIRSYVFRPGIVTGLSIFKVTSLRVSPTFVTGDFVRAWRHASLRGLGFRRLWSPQPGVGA